LGAAALVLERWAAAERPLETPRWNFHKYLVGRDGHIAAVFATDPAMRECELLYVLDSPEQEREATLMLRELSLIYGLPARLVIMQRNGGYALGIRSHLDVMSALYSKEAKLVLGCRSGQRSLRAAAARCRSN
jgi:rhodanese-related sulfurtransferase